MNNQIPWHEISQFFSGGDGSSPQQAVRINMLLLPDVDMRHMAGVQLEYAWIERHFPNYKFKGQHLHTVNGCFDCIEIQLPSGETLKLYFEISTFFVQKPTPAYPTPPSAIPPAKSAAPANEPSITIREDIRPLAGFYADAAQRQRVHGLFAREFLPHYVHQDPHYFFSFLDRTPMTDELVEPTRFIQSRWNLMEMRVGLIPSPTQATRHTVFRRVSDLTMGLHRVNGHPAAVVKMPPPEHANQAWLVVMVLMVDADQPAGWPLDALVRVFTLDTTAEGLKAAPPAGTITEWTREMQPQPHNIVVAAETNAFLQAVEKVIKVPGNL